MKYILFILISPLLIFAHPHTFIDLYPTIVSKEDKIESIKFRWLMDEMSSQMLIMEFDKNLNGKIDKDENKYVKENYFDHLVAYMFYTKIKDKTILTKPINFVASIEKERVVYSFTINLDEKKSDFYIDFYDEDNFVAIMLKKEFVTSDIKYNIEGIDNDFYYTSRLSFEKDK